MPSSLPLALVTNDDGIDSPFLHVLMRALSKYYRVVVAAPLGEQSWIGRAMSRRRDVSVHKAVLDGFEAWSIDGTPTDCVNIALGHLVKETPAIVISGINIGFNTSMPLLLSSGTLAGAIEGAHWGLPSLAASQALPSAVFDQLQADRTQMPGQLRPILEASAHHVADAAGIVIDEGQPGLIVHNLNYPASMTRATPVEKTLPGHVSLGSLYATEDGERYHFTFQGGTVHPADQQTDRAVLMNGSASWTRLNFSNLGESIEIENSV